MRRTVEVHIWSVSSRTASVGHRRHLSHLLPCRPTRWRIKPHQVHEIILFHNPQAARQCIPTL